MRNEKGLIDGVKYHFLPNGFVDWEKMINPSYIVLFKEKKKEIEKKYGDFNEAQAQMQSGELEVENKYRLVLLQGWRELAILRGYSGYEYTHFISSPQHSAIACRITWIGNYETGGNPVFSTDGADAHANNTNDFATSYLTTIACNRAFGRTVRSFLNINILGRDEIADKFSIPQEVASNILSVPSPSSALEKYVATLGVRSYDDFRKYLHSLNEKGLEVIPESEYKTWRGYKSFEDIPKKTCMFLIGKIKGLENDKN